MNRISGFIPCDVPGKKGMTGIMLKGQDLAT